MHSMFRGGAHPERVCRLHSKYHEITYLTHSSPGSMADMPEDLHAQVKDLERLFVVDGAKLKEITNHFVKELEKGG